ncbi:MAG: peptide-methionine (S)-S-oxide reductase MsrA [Magnetococcus sp. YQC-9]
MPPPILQHFVSKTPLTPPYPDGSLLATFGMGCFWGAEHTFWQLEGVLVTAVGYAGGQEPKPTYEQVCTGLTGHTEVVLVVFDPSRIDYVRLLTLFWEGHDPTQGMRQGHDIGTQYRSVIHTHSEIELQQALASRDRFQTLLTRAGYGPITTEILPAPEFHFAEAYHQQYLAKNPHGYCGLGGTGVRFAP